MVYGIVRNHLRCVEPQLNQTLSNVMLVSENYDNY